jgi:hypothetical protein
MKVLIESSAIIDYLKGNEKVKEVILNSEDSLANRKFLSQRPLI